MVVRITLLDDQDVLSASCRVSTKQGMTRLAVIYVSVPHCPAPGCRLIHDRALLLLYKLLRNSVKFTDGGLGREVAGRDSTPER